MHLSRLCLLSLVFFLFVQDTHSQSSGFGSDLDIILEDNTRRKTDENKDQPKFDDEFRSNQITEEEKLEQEMKDAQKVENPNLDQEEQQVETLKRETVPLQEEVNKDLQTELQDSAPLQQKLPEEQIEELNFGSSPEIQPQVAPAEPSPSEKAEETPSFEPDVQPEDLEQIAPLEEPYEEERETNPEQFVEPIPEQQLQEEQDPVVEIEPDEPLVPKPMRVDRPLAPLKSEKIYSKEELEKISEQTNVTIEDTDFIPGTKTLGKADILKPYKERRADWSTKFEVLYSMYEPINYTSEIVPTVFEEYYESGDVPLSGIGLEVKRNFSFGAISLGGSVAYYSTEAVLDDAQLTLIAPSLKATLYLDTLFKEPYVVPYASFGYTYFSYTEDYEDTVEIIEVSGETDNFYISFGLEFQLDWLDKPADISAYNSGLENTFIFVEGRMYLDQGIIRAQEDPDFSTDLYLAAGLRLEF